MDTLRPPQALLQTALVIVDRDGVDALTVRALVRESGISNGSVYHHVGSLDRLRALVADEALQDWADSFLQALQDGGYASAVAADLAWSRQHPALAELIETESQHGRLGRNAVRFGKQLRLWLDNHHLAVGAPAHLVSAIVIGPLTELRRVTRDTHVPSAADLAALDTAVIAALRALNDNR
ncbi:TetR/AcrR family transcriptional regulator [Mycolicibacterium aubagnense]|uniref:TetR family transcriptional regulator n=1 Tax=Mycolicibacterium aubagnense TaxID=319707 RepID=A0ABM7IK95_9MYCO|nr:TetR family transcriptional regulator [Mycolicibacterium aubagnense]WGI31415.1 TetR family transcriptional regulator [Mycolicibacterium aubagnense]BBX87147.1 TetR family transcriptional regulator [Mycolicibacterium aubagnense]